MTTPEESLKAQGYKPVIVTTIYRGVFFGYTKNHMQTNVNLRRARMAIQWGTTQGLLELAETGPTSQSKIGAVADAYLHGVNAVFRVTPEAEQAWLEAQS